MNTSAWILVISSFLASAVEGVEAMTVVLATGTTRGWRSTLIGAGAALLALAGVIVILGPALASVPIDILRLVVGALLLVFGLQWLRKAILRASGYKRLRDEDAIYQAQLVAAEHAGSKRELGMDWYSFTVTFKSVFLEGFEVAFIVLTFGVAQGSIPLAAVGAIAALLIVVAVGALLKEPLSRVPENTIKFAVGILLTSFGVFWSSEGAGVSMPGSDTSILGILVFLLIVSFGLIALLRRIQSSSAAPVTAPAKTIE